MRATTYIARQIAALLGYAQSPVIEPSRRLVRRRSASSTVLDRASVAELIKLADNLLRQYGRDVEGDDRVIRCFATDKFFVSTHTVEPSLVRYQISQHADGENTQVFVAMWHRTSGITELQLYRNGPWRRRFRNFACDSLEPAPPQLQH